ncbi:MAG: phosphate ABC transporter permease PstA [Spirulinaceae cyanobacterium RM2_2_10]|nr:phosphate ABC transporter permease PstA [Spirulinaceae cyanobacterium SM2_1_0]NJO19305.1 phosphate ABC transporter permease PstA [Spirulinaceae cyanobacterium RM2_2_10]
MSELSPAALLSNLKTRRVVNRGFAVLGILAIAIATLILLVLLSQMLIRGLPRFSGDFFLSFPSRFPEKAGILSAWVGTILVMLVTVTAAVPLGIASGIYLEEYAPKNWLSDFIEVNVTNLAGVPSIIYGLLALGLFVYNLGMGDSILTAGLTLALLILPIVVVTTREALRAVPTNIREAAYATGATKWQVTWDHVLRYSLSSIMTGVIIGLSRAIGETAPLITIGALTYIAFLPEPPLNPDFPFVPLTARFPFLNFQQLFAWLHAPFTVMPIQVFNWVSLPDKDFHINAAAAGSVLIGMTLTMNAFAIYLRHRFRKGIKW